MFFLFKRRANRAQNGLRHPRGSVDFGWRHTTVRANCRPKPLEVRYAGRRWPLGTPLSTSPFAFSWWLVKSERCHLVALCVLGFVFVVEQCLVYREKLPRSEFPKSLSIRGIRKVAWKDGVVDPIEAGDYRVPATCNVHALAAFLECRTVSFRFLLFQAFLSGRVPRCTPFWVRTIKLHYTVLPFYHQMNLVPVVMHWEGNDNHSASVNIIIGCSTDKVIRSIIYHACERQGRVRSRSSKQANAALEGDTRRNI